jgi:fatty-acyl-CoA synthase
MPHNRFLASYGLSEVAPASITLYIDSEDHVLHTVGRIVEGVEIRIIDPETKKDCPNGVSGEIIVKSPRLMAGYYRIPADDQALDEDGWIHTGDLGFIREDDGYLVLCGRIKDLIIRGGENIMPSQVENAISSFDFIDNVRVLGIPSDFFGEEVAACIILKDGTTYDEKALRSALSQKLAKFKMPTYIEVYDSFPMLGSGKIDSIKLKEDLIHRISLNK